MACKPIALFLFKFLLLCLIVGSANATGLRIGFYSKSCRDPELIVRNITHRVIRVAPSLAGALLRLHFHDCFVRGCDGSVLLNSSTGGKTEKDASPNLTLRGYQIIDRIKTSLENACPGVVSCADITALVARDVVVETGGPSWDVETGRRDGVVSNETEALINIPSPFFNVTILKAIFQSNRLTPRDLAVLSGAHTIGFSHCSGFKYRLYNFTGKGIIDEHDPALNSRYASQLRKKCMLQGPDNMVQLDPGSNKRFDLHYYSIVSRKRGLLQSDAALLDDLETKAYVESHKSGDPTAFFKDFGASMVNMGRMGVLTGKAGQIRKVCSKVN